MENPGGGRSRRGPDRTKEPVFQLQPFVLGAGDLFLEFLELRGDEAFGVDQGLLADEVLGHMGQLAAADFDIVAEDLVEADLEVANAGARPLAGLQPQNQRLAVAQQAHQFVKLRVVTGPDQVAFPQGHRGVLADGYLQQGLEFAQFVHRAEVGQQGVSPGKLFRDFRQLGQGRLEGREIAAIGRAQHHPAVETLQIVDLAQQFPELLPQPGGEAELFHRVQPLPDILNLPQGKQEVFLEQPGSHGGFAEIKSVQQRPLPDGAGDGLGGFAAGHS